MFLIIQDEIIRNLITMNYKFFKKNLINSDRNHTFDAYESDFFFYQKSLKQMFKNVFLVKIALCSRVENSKQLIHRRKKSGVKCSY